MLAYRYFSLNLNEMNVLHCCSCSRPTVDVIASKIHGVGAVGDHFIANYFLTYLLTYRMLCNVV